MTGVLEECYGPSEWKLSLFVAVGHVYEADNYEKQVEYCHIVHNDVYVLGIRGSDALEPVH